MTFTYIIMQFKKKKRHEKKKSMLTLSENLLNLYITVFCDIGNQNFEVFTFFLETSHCYTCTYNDKNL